MIFDEQKLMIKLKHILKKTRRFLTLSKSSALDINVLINLLLFKINYNSFNFPVKFEVIF